VESLKTAAKSRKKITWDTYSFATNARYTGAAHEAIAEEARALKLADTEIEFLGPEHWDRLCEQFPLVAQERLDYRVTLSEARVIEALKSARYFDRFVEEAKQKMAATPESLTLTNNRTPLELTIPFSKDLTIEMLLDVVRETLDVSLDWKNYPDTQTSCGPSVSITIDRVPQSFRTKLGELSPDARKKLQFFIQLVWQDETEAKRAASDVGKTQAYLLYRWTTADRNTLSESERRELTLSRTETLLQAQIWESARRLRNHADALP
jgi:hypothetical protein